MCLPRLPRSSFAAAHDHEKKRKINQRSGVGHGACETERARALGSRAWIAKEGRGGGQGSCNGRGHYCRGSSSAQGFPRQKGAAETERKDRLRVSRPASARAFPVPAAPRELSRLLPPPPPTDSGIASASASARQGGNASYWRGEPVREGANPTRRARDRAEPRRRSWGSEEQGSRLTAPPPPRRPPPPPSAAVGGAEPARAHGEVHAILCGGSAPPSLYPLRLHHC